MYEKNSTATNELIDKQNCKLAITNLAITN